MFPNRLIINTVDASFMFGNYVLEGFGFEINIDSKIYLL